jgi:hypothetical protein
VNSNKDEVLQLSGALLCKSAEEIKEKLGYSPIDLQDRKKLATQLVKVISSHGTVKANRLDQLMT